MRLSRVKKKNPSVFEATLFFFISAADELHHSVSSSLSTPDCVTVLI